MKPALTLLTALLLASHTAVPACGTAEELHC